VRAAGRGDAADARLHHHGAAVEHQGLADGVEQPARQRPELGRLARRHHREAIALEPHQPLAGVERLLESGAGHRQQRVAGADAERLVHRAEPVEVEDHQPDRRGAAGAAHRRLDQPLHGRPRPDRRPKRRGGVQAPHRRRGAGEKRRGQGRSVAHPAGEAGAQPAGSAPRDQHQPGGCARCGGETGRQPELRGIEPHHRADRQPGAERARQLRRADQRRESLGRADEPAAAALEGIDADRLDVAPRRQKAEIRGREAVLALGLHRRVVPPDAVAERRTQPKVA
jgi:hypothetical protein